MLLLEAPKVSGARRTRIEVTKRLQKGLNASLILRCRRLWRIGGNHMQERPSCLAELLFRWWTTFLKR